MFRRFLLFVFFVVFTLGLRAQGPDLGKAFQKDKQAQIDLLHGEEYFELGLYLNALPLYRKIEIKYGATPYLMFRIGVCLLYKSDEAIKSLDYLMQVKQQNPKAADIDYYLARAYHLNGRFDEALASIDAFVNPKNKPDPKKRAEAERLRTYCNNGKILVASPINAKITNLGAPVNTEASEYVPIVTSDDSTLLFTYAGPKSTGGLQRVPGESDSAGIYFEDIFISRRTATGWGDPVPLDSSINGNGHDACIASSNDGEQLLLYKNSPDDNGDIYTSQLFGLMYTYPEHVPGEVNTYNWEGSASLSSDGRMMIFASEREGGFGGRDLWMAILQYDGTWGHIRNLGPKINTPYNEDAPYFHPNGVSMIFSSEGHNSMGGYDIFQSALNVLDTSFSLPQNIGYPINTPGDDKYFILAADGKHGYYSSGRPGGMGLQDIYEVEADFDLHNANILQISGLITLDDHPVRASVIIRQDSSLTNYYFHSNASTGRYLVNLPQGKPYTIIAEIDGIDRKSISVSPDTASEMLRRNFNIAFYSPAYLAIQARRDSVTSNNTVLAKADSSNTTDYSVILKTYGDAKADGLYYRVQIAAYIFPQNYKYGSLNTLGPIDKITLDDGITRFTMGKFETFAEAEAFRQKVVEAGADDAFVTAERQGKRYLLRELVKLKFFSK